MFKSGFGLAVGIRNFQVVLPFADEKRLAVDLGCNLANVLNVAVLHRQDQVSLVQHVTVDLARTVGGEFQPVVLQYFMGGFVHGVTY